MSKRSDDPDFIDTEKAVDAFILDRLRKKRKGSDDDSIEINW